MTQDIGVHARLQSFILRKVCISHSVKLLVPGNRVLTILGCRADLQALDKYLNLYDGKPKWLCM